MPRTTRAVVVGATAKSTHSAPIHNRHRRVPTIPCPFTQGSTFLSHTSRAVNADTNCQSGTAEAAPYVHRPRSTPMPRSTYVQRHHARVGHRFSGAVRRTQTFLLLSRARTTGMFPVGSDGGPLAHAPDAEKVHESAERGTSARWCGACCFGSARLVRPTGRATNRARDQG